MGDKEDFEKLVEGLNVVISEPESKGEWKFGPSNPVPMIEYLTSIGKTCNDLDEAQVRENVGATWVAREGTSELPVPFVDLVL